MPVEAATAAGRPRRARSHESSPPAVEKNVAAVDASTSDLVSPPDATVKPTGPSHAFTATEQELANLPETAGDTEAASQLEVFSARGPAGRQPACERPKPRRLSDRHAPIVHLSDATEVAATMDHPTTNATDISAARYTASRSVACDPVAQDAAGAAEIVSVGTVEQAVRSRLPAEALTQRPGRSNQPEKQSRETTASRQELADAPAVAGDSKGLAIEPVVSNHSPATAGEFADPIQFSSARSYVRKSASFPATINREAHIKPTLRQSISMLKHRLPYQPIAPPRIEQTFPQLARQSFNCPRTNTHRSVLTVSRSPRMPLGGSPSVRTCRLRCWCSGPLAQIGPRLTEIDTARLLGRVARAFTAAQERDGEIRLRLSPPELGSLLLEVRIQDGALVARLETETDAARTAIVENLPALRERLNEQGVRIERFDVDLMQRQPGGMPDQPGGSSTTHRQAPSESPRRRVHARNQPSSRPSNQPRTAVSTSAGSTSSFNALNCNERNAHAQHQLHRRRSSTLRHGVQKRGPRPERPGYQPVPAAHDQPS